MLIVVERRETFHHYYPMSVHPPGDLTVTLKLPYFYGHEAEHYSFYRIPKQLISDSRFRNVSTDAKLLYGLMLDRMGLSMKNGRFDEQGRVYIFFVLDEIQGQHRITGL